MAKRTETQAQALARSLSCPSSLAGPLQGYTFAVRTNLKKKLLTNRDALCILFYAHGHMTLKQARDALMTWREGKATYEVVECVDYRFGGGPPGDITYRVRPTVTHGYLFNLADGYGHCGEDLMSPGSG